MPENADKRPPIVCLCGSTRFYEQFQEANYIFTMRGVIVLTVGFYPHASTQIHGEALGCTPRQKAELDELHKRKIDLADTVFVLDVNGYIGDSTRSEIEYARAHDKTICTLSETGLTAPLGVLFPSFQFPVSSLREPEVS